MRIEKLSLSGFRNLAPTTVSFCDGVNILYGDNAQGKTNLLEACWLFTGGKSFRGAKDSELVAFDAQKAELSMDFEAGERMQKAQITISNRRSLILNDVSQKSPTVMAEKFHAVVFCPAHLRLIAGAPEERRRFLDAAYCQLRPAYIGVLSEHNRILTQRNALLRRIKREEIKTAVANEMLSLWDESLACSAAKVTAARVAYLKKILPKATEIYHGLSAGTEKLGLMLQSGVDGENPSGWRDAFFKKLCAAHAQDMAVGHTTVGAHRADMEITIDGISAKDFGSQGQQRSLVLALKLAESSLLKEITGEQPVALLDDVMSELDLKRQDYILNHIHDWQVLITCCDPIAIERQTGGQVFHIQNGQIVK